MKIYEFSVPMPYTKEGIDKLIDINNTVSKSKIKSLYFGLPNSCKLFSGFELNRFNHKISDFEYWKELIKYSISLNFDFIYLLNLPDAIDLNNIEERIYKLEILLQYLYDIGVKNLRISNPQLLEYIHKNYTKFNLFASTSLDFQSIKQYENFIEYHPFIKQIVFSTDNNKNFKLIANLIKRYPEVEFELMVNEGCIIGCSHRQFHYRMTNVIPKSQNVFHPDYYSEACANLNLTNSNIANYLCRTNIVYPWQIQEYFNVGLNKFKLCGRESENFITGKYINFYKLYLQGIDDINSISDVPISIFSNYVYNKDLIPYTLNEIKPHIPNIKYFKKYGHLCSVRCESECRYCYKCAQKLQKLLNKKVQKINRMNTPCCFKNN